MLVANGMTHVGQALYFGGYVPGVVTAILITSPYGWALMRVLARNGIAPRATFGSWSSSAWSCNFRSRCWLWLRLRGRKLRAGRSIRRWLLSAVVLAGVVQELPAQQRLRARALGVVPGMLAPGPSNSITDVSGVKVGQVTVTSGDSVRTGVTAILPHSGNLFLERVPAAVHVGNGFGKLLGTTQVSELGELETPILLTCTLCVWKAADAMVEWMLGQPGMENVRSINPVVGETNDGYELNTAIRSRPITAAQVRQALT